MDLAYIPSPSDGVWHLGPLPLRGYALAILLGIFAAIWLGGRRWIERGGRPGTVADIAIWAVPFGLVGGRLYHVVTTPEPYFGEDGDWAKAFEIWEGGLGIWGAIAMGALGVWIGCRRRGIAMPPYADAVAPGIALAQALGRWGNWFNQELYGKQSDAPWAVEIDADHSITGAAETFHPTFLYESLWCVGVALLVIWADRRFRLGHGRAFALYVAGYTAGRGWIEYLRVDDAHEVLGLRLNVWTSILVFAAAVAYMVVSAKKRPGREEVVEPGAADGGPADADEGDEGDVSLTKAGSGADGADGRDEPGDAAGTAGVPEPASAAAAEATGDAPAGERGRHT
ncbi:prolipoprotein diacylglyceryl transferase [Streptomyces sp. WMMC500]|uniref:prolipoprotein diacylglyceryl transferase n=1 Tax=Streptomyces sp. WMMC500 TaxID=3015154 RepID=UPI00248B52F4|nr:prolipoprotein diacylglyceryl transferase [Streptomyces sp. WMMC500]WBB59970.1 prolipoprotein diacylglyceryl transferase [Streptomyces sp. WMMC500]